MIIIENIAEFVGRIPEGHELVVFEAGQVESAIALMGFDEIGLFDFKSYRRVSTMSKRSELESHVAEFLAKGGVIQSVPAKEKKQKQIVQQKSSVYNLGRQKYLHHRSYA